MTKFKIVHGVILSCIDYRDVDGIFTVFSQEEGQITVIARGIKKIKSKFKAFLGLGAVLNLELVYKNDNWPLITGVNSIFLPTICQYHDLIMFSTALNLTKQLCKPQHILMPVFFLLSEFINYFSHHPKLLLLTAYKLKLISTLGFLGSLKLCTKCGNKISSQSHYWSIHGIICHNCYQDSKLVLYPIDFLHIKILAFIQTSTFKEINCLNLSVTDNSIIEKMVNINISELS